MSKRLEMPILLASAEPRRRLFARDAKVEALKRVPALAGLAASAYRRLARHVDQVTVEPGRTLFREGRRNQTLWVILDGEVELTVGTRTACVVGPGELLGTSSMLDGEAAGGTAVTKTRVEALVAGPLDFRAFESDPDVELRLKAASRDVLRSEVRALRKAG